LDRLIAIIFRVFLRILQEFAPLNSVIKLTRKRTIFETAPARDSVKKYIVTARKLSYNAIFGVFLQRLYKNLKALPFMQIYFYYHA